MLAPLFKGFGMMPAIAQVYLVEVVEEKNRNLLGTCFAVSISIGITLVYVSGYVMKSYELVCWTFLAIIALLMFLICFVPESPIWLQQSGQYDKALAAAKKLWGFQFEFINEKKDKVFMALQNIES